MINKNVSNKNYKFVYTRISLDLYQKIKQNGLKLNYLISRGYNCTIGLCPTTLFYKNQIEQYMKKIAELELETEDLIEENVRKYAEEIEKLENLKSYLILLLKHLLKKYVKTKEQFENELNEIFNKHAKQEFLELVQEKRISLDF